jgi:ATP-dependent Clp protease ATP-binding subunit ClpA
MSFTDNAAKLIAEESYSVKYGARNMRRYIQRNIEDVIAEYIVSDVYGKISNVSISVKSGALHIECN